MANLKTKFAGLELKNPIIVGSSGLTESVDKIKELAKHGAGAVILKSLFEEQITFEANHTISSNHKNEYPEAADYIKSYTKNNTLTSYLNLIRDAKKEVDIPIIASINCITANQWLTFAKSIQEAGADALEVNVFILPIDKNKTSKEYEELYHTLFKKLKKHITIPVIFKIGQQFTNLTALLNRFNAEDVSGVTLFNRFYQPDIDIEMLSTKSAEVFSTELELRNVMRWVAIASGKISGLDISASTGVHSGEAAIKLLLAGATSIQVCSTIYKNGPEKVAEIINDIEKWMNKKSFQSIEDFRGKLNHAKVNNPEMYERSQFMKHFSNHV